MDLAVLVGGVIGKQVCLPGQHAQPFLLPGWRNIFQFANAANFFRSLKIFVNSQHGIGRRTKIGMCVHVYWHPFFTHVRRGSFTNVIYKCHWTFLLAISETHSECWLHLKMSRHTGAEENRYPEY